MPSLTQTLPDLMNSGPVLEVQFLISTELEKKYKEEGKSLPNPITIKSLIDTGASHCVLQQEIPKKLGLEPIDKVKMNTPSCQNHECFRYFLRMVIPSHNLVYEGVFIAAPLAGQNINCLIGLNLLAHGILIYIGYANQFTLSLL